MVAALLARDHNNIFDIKSYTMYVNGDLADKNANKLYTSVPWYTPADRQTSSWKQKALRIVNHQYG
jgi:hypothetical protein